MSHYREFLQTNTRSTSRTSSLFTHEQTPKDVHLSLTYTQFLWRILDYCLKHQCFTEHIILTFRHTGVIFKCAPTNENTVFRACGRLRATDYIYVNWDVYRALWSTTYARDVIRSTDWLDARRKWNLYPISLWFGILCFEFAYCVLRCFNMKTARLWRISYIKV